MKSCRNCGTSSSNNHIVCPECGAKEFYQDKLANSDIGFTASTEEENYRTDQRSNYGPIAAVQHSILHWCDFEGRASRSEGIYFLLAVFLGDIISNILDFVILGGERWNNTPVGPAVVIFGVLVLIPALSLIVRRCHDLNVSGAWGVSAYGVAWISAVVIFSGDDESGAVLLAALLYFLSVVFLMVLQCFMPSKHQNNGYGSAPAYFA